MQRVMKIIVPLRVEAQATLGGGLQDTRIV